MPSSHDQAYQTAHELLELLEADTLDRASWAHAAVLCLVIAYNIEQAREREDQQWPKKPESP